MTINVPKETLEARSYQGQLSRLWHVATSA